MPSLSQQQSPFPAGEGRDIVAVACMQCHGPGVIVNQRLGADAWLEASSIGLTLNADSLARVVQDCTGFTGP